MLAPSRKRSCGRGRRRSRCFRRGIRGVRFDVALQHAHGAYQVIILVEGHGDNVLVGEASVFMCVEIAERAVAIKFEQSGQQ